MPRIIRAIVAAASLAAAACAIITPSASASSAPLGTYDYLLAPTSDCPKQTSSALPIAMQERAMRCLTNYARTSVGLRPLVHQSKLDWSATSKAHDLRACNAFSHTACGRRFDFWIRRSGWRGHRWGENIAWGSDTASRSTPRSIMRAWLHSDAHRKNILQPAYTQLGIGLLRAPFQGWRSGIWVQHFGLGR